MPIIIANASSGAGADGFVMVILFVRGLLFVFV